MVSLSVAILPVTPLQQNCTLLWDEDNKNAAVIDPGGDVNQILNVVMQQELKVSKIILTHGHIDHAGGAAELKQALEEKGDTVPIEGPHIDDKFLLDDLANAGAQYGMSGARNVTPDLWLEDGGVVNIIGLDFDIRHCPGHSPGSLVYINKNVKLALVGDVIFKGSIGRTDFEYGDHDALIKAIKTHLLPLDDDITFICGHGPVSTIGEERHSNPFIA
tara:strand:+ start:71 stop:724 length:654 start_codon:yes stop_codon:yes gene_type:complete